MPGVNLGVQTPIESPIADESPTGQALKGLGNWGSVVSRGGNAGSSDLGNWAGVFGLEQDKPAAAPAPVAPEQGDFSRGLSTSIQQTKQLAYGVKAAIGDTIGNTQMRDEGIQQYQDVEKQLQANAKPSDSFSEAVKSGDLLDWAQYGAGYVAGQAGEALLSGGIGSFIGKAVAKTVLKKTLEGALKGAIEKKVAAGMARDAAVSSAFGTLGAGVALGGFNLTQELGQIYPDALQEAQKRGEDVDLFKVFGSSVLAAGIESAADMFNLGKLGRAARGVERGGESVLRNVAVESFKGGMREGLTELAQTGVERFGAGQSLTDPDAIRDYVDSAALGALGGHAFGAVAGAVKKRGAAPVVEEPAEAPPVDAGEVPGVVPAQPIEVTDELRKKFAPDLEARGVDPMSEQGTAVIQRLEGVERATGVIRARQAEQERSQREEEVKAAFGDTATSGVGVGVGGAEPMIRRDSVVPNEAERTLEPVEAAAKPVTLPEEDGTSTHAIAPEDVVARQEGWKVPPEFEVANDAGEPQKVPNRFVAFGTALKTAKQYAITTDDRQFQVREAKRAKSEGGGRYYFVEERPLPSPDAELVVGHGTREEIAPKEAKNVTVAPSPADSAGAAAPAAAPAAAEAPVPAPVAREAAVEPSAPAARPAPVAEDSDEASWTRMPTVEREAAAERAGVGKRVRNTAWGDLTKPMQRKLSQAMKVDQPSTTKENQPHGHAEAPAAAQAGPDRVPDAAQARGGYAVDSGDRDQIAARQAGFKRIFGDDYKASLVESLDEVPATHRSEFEQSVRVAKQLFGKKVLLVKQNRPTFNGAFNRNYPKHILLDVQTRKPSLVVLGHELLHTIRRDDPHLYERMLEDIKSSLASDAPERYKSALLEAYRGTKLKLSDDQITEEMVADLLGSRFMEPEFWQAVHDALNPSVFRRIAQSVLRALDQLAGKLSAYSDDRGVDSLVKDVNALRKVMAAYVAERIDSQPENLPQDEEAQEQLSLTKKQQALSIGQYLYDFKLRPVRLGTNAQVGAMLQEKALKALGGPITENTPANRRLVAQVMAHETVQALERKGNAGSWYKDNLAGAMRAAAELYPEIGTDPDQRFLFSFALAVTSNGQTVAENTRLAFEAYAAYRQLGYFPTHINGGGERAHSMRDAFSKFNEMALSAGVPALRSALLKKWNAKELKDSSGKPIKALADDIVYGGILFGPKIGGAFLQNLNGNFDALTVDLWFMRMWGRMTGNLVNESGALNDSPKSAGQRKFIRETAEQALEMVRASGHPIDMADMQAALWYPEKELYQTLGRQNERSAPTDYHKEVEAYVKRQSGRDLRGPQPGGRRAAGGAEQAAGVAVPGAAQDELFSAAASELPDGRGVRGGAESVALDSRPQPGTRGTSLQGLAADVRVDGQLIHFGGFKPAQDAARAYAAKAKLEYNPPTTYVKVDPARARRIADAYEAMPHDPTNPEVKAAYDALVAETIAQYEAILDTGLKVEFNPPGTDPYGNPRNAILDVTRNNHLYIFPTDDGFGSTKDVDVSNSPMLAPTKHKISGRTAVANDIFRVVHDYFGHIKEGVGFRADGEENAWRAHAAMYSPLARRAATTETRGQNSWVNYGPFAESNKNASGADTQYAPQKVGLLPEWVSEDGANDEQLSVPISRPGWDEATVKALNEPFEPTPQAPIKQRLQGLRHDFLRRFTAAVLDPFVGLKDLDDKLYMRARLSNGTDGGLDALLHFGQVYDHDGALDVRKGTKGLIAALKPLGNEVEDFFRWVALNRAAELKKQDRENFFTDRSIQLRGKLIEGKLPDGRLRTTVYNQALRDMNALNRSVLELARNSGLLDQAGFDRFSRDMWYVPFYRVIEENDNDVAAFAAAAGLSSQKFGERLKGGTDRVAGLLPNLLRNWGSLLTASQKNSVARDALAEAEKMGAAHQVTSSAKGAAKVMVDGRQKTYAITDPMLANAVLSINMAALNHPALKVFGVFKRTLTHAVTFDPAFKIRNLLRDSIQSIALGDLPFNPIANVYNGIAGLRGEARASVLAGGGLFGHNMDERDLSAKIKLLAEKGINEKTILQHPDDVVRFAFDKYAELGENLENANRVALYNSMIGKGKSHLEAAYAARDLMDFSLQGRASAVRMLAMVLPFFNARLQGLYKIGRDGVVPTMLTIMGKADEEQRAKAARFVAVAGAVTLAGLALYLHYKDDRDFQQREQWDRDNFWWFKSGGVAYRIPKPFELGAIGTMAERALEQLVDPKVGGAVFAQSVHDMLMNTFAFDPVPQAFRPLLNLVGNEDSFTQRPIETLGSQNLSKTQRFNSGTSETAKVLSSANQAAADALGPLGQGKVLSPAQIDYLARGYFGWVGATIMQGTGHLLKWGDPVQAPSPKVDDYPLVGSFVRDLPSNQSHYVSDFYKTATQVDQLWNDIKSYQRLGQYDKAREAIAENRSTLQLHALYERATREISAINQQMRRVQASPQMNADQKRSSLDTLAQRKADLAMRVELLRRERQMAR